MRQYIARHERWNQIITFGDSVAAERGLTEEDVDQAAAEERGKRHA